MKFLAVVQQLFQKLNTQRVAKALPPLKRKPKFSDFVPQAEHLLIQNRAEFHLVPARHLKPAHVRVILLPPSSPELSSVEVIGDGIKARMGNARWARPRRPLSIP